jgi:GntR family transcriptional regulator, transcriptional repressor for pyruvate dehydrogenase complex
MTSFRAVERRSVADAVHEQLRRRILDGSLEPGAALPSERALTEQFGVNRHAVREALKRLAEVGLVEIAHGGATRVRDWRRTAGLEVLADAALDDPRVLGDALRMRRAIGADVARLAAAARAEVAERPATADGYELLWSDLVDAAGNLAYRLALNALQSAIHRIRDEFAELSRPEIDDLAAQAALREAVAAGDGDRAAALAHELLDRTLEAVGG